MCSYMSVHLCEHVCECACEYVSLYVFEGECMLVSVCVYEVCEYM